MLDRLQKKKAFDRDRLDPDAADEFRIGQKNLVGFASVLILRGGDSGLIDLPKLRDCHRRGLVQFLIERDRALRVVALRLCVADFGDDVGRIVPTVRR